MATFSVSYCTQMVAEYKSALSTVLRGQSYSIGGRSLTRANLSEIQSGLEYWNDQLATAEEAGASGGRRRVSFRRTIIHG